MFTAKRLIQGYLGVCMITGFCRAQQQILKNTVQEKIKIYLPKQLKYIMALVIL
jgi:ABC-type uncharacterized transport system permease subunit